MHCSALSRAAPGNVLVDVFEASGSSVSDQSMATNEFVLRCRLMQAEPFPGLGALLLAVLKRKPGSSGSVDVTCQDAASLSIGEAKALGAAFCRILAAKLAARQPAEAVVAEWLGQYAVLRLFARHSEWFAPMLEGIAHRQMGTVSGLRRLTEMARRSSFVRSSFIERAPSNRVIDVSSSPQRENSPARRNSHAPDFVPVVRARRPRLFCRPLPPLQSRFAASATERPCHLQAPMCIPARVTVHPTSGETSSESRIRKL